MKRAGLVVFAGPSITPREVRAIARCQVLPPARQGDVWRCLELRPQAIALIDGVFESQPSVWHHEILAALRAGVMVFGAASMGALRAAELWQFGMVGVGKIFGWVRDGIVVDDSEVALLHAGAEHGHRGLTLPLVNVRHAAEQAVAKRILTRPEARALVESAAGIFYQERTWSSVLQALAQRWPPRTRARWDAWAARGLEDLKHLDALECVRVAAEYVRAHLGAPPPAPVGGQLAWPSSLVRRRRLVETGRRGKHEDAERGLKRALLAGWARELGLVAPPQPGGRAPRGLDSAEAARLLEDVALERMVLQHASRLLSDGPSPDEASAAEASLRQPRRPKP